MEFESNFNVPYCDPNAYVQGFKKDNSNAKKVVFQQPYECMPPHYQNNNFCKHGCECVKPLKPKHECDYKDNKKNENNFKPSFPFSFDIKTLLPLLSNLGGSNNGGISNIISMLGNKSSNNETGNTGFDFSKLISTFMSNSNGFNLLNLFGKKKETNKKEVKTTDIPIKNYTRVE